MRARWRRRCSSASASASSCASRREGSVRELVVRLRLGAKLIAEGGGLFLGQALLDLRLHVGQRRELRFASVLELDDVIAELRLHRLLRVFTLLQLYHRLGELGNIGVGAGETEGAEIGRAHV